MFPSKKSTKKYHLVSSTSKMKRVSHQTPFSNVLQKHLKQNTQQNTNAVSTKHQNANNIVHNNNIINNNNNDIKKKEYPYTKTKSTLYTVCDNLNSGDRHKTPTRRKEDIHLSTGASMKNCFVNHKTKPQNESGTVNSKRNDHKDVNDYNSNNKSRDKKKTNEIAVLPGNNTTTNSKVAMMFMKQGQNRETSARERRQLINNFYQNCNLIKSELNIFNNEIELSNESKHEDEHNEKDSMQHDNKMLVDISHNNDSNEKEEDKQLSQERTITKDNATTISVQTHTNINTNNTNNSVTINNNNTINTCSNSINTTSIKHAVTVNQHANKRKQVKETPKDKTSQENSEFFDYGDEKPIELSKDEKDIFGSREMKGYQKIKLLGKGGCGVVWLAIDKKTKREVAVKQVSKKINSSLFTAFAENNNYIAKNEIDILTNLNADTKCEYIVEIYNSYEDNNDIWFAFEKGGKCLSSLSFKIKGEFLKTERIYSIKKGKFIQMLFSHINQFKLLIHHLLIAIDFINSKGIIHADIKPENILIDYIDDNESNETKFEISKVKVIDFGSAFYADNPCSISSNTPEYLCPELTEILEGKSKKKKSFLNDLHKYTSCVDIWSLGVTLLELVLACPVWMSYKAKVVINGKVLFKTGLFGFKGRDGHKINNKQIEVTQNLHKLLSQSLIYSFEKEEKEMFEDLLSKMLKADYKSRITPQEALQHPFLRSVNINQEKKV